MRPFTRLASAAIVVVALVGTLAAPALAESDGGHGNHDFDHRHGNDHVVFVQTDDPAGNQVVAYDRASDGTLTFATAYATGGNGGVLAGSVVDHLASQGSLVYDARHALLFAVNAGSNTVSVFSVRGDRLDLQQVISSGGQFPVSVAVHGGLVYVLNARAGGSVQGYVIAFDHLFPLFGPNRPLGLDASATPEFVNTPGQVAFSPDGAQLIVTTKANGNAIDVFHVGFFGSLSAKPVVNTEPGTVPFAITFDPAGNLVIAEAGTNALATYSLHNDGTITPLGSVGTGQAATCWVATVNGQFYVSNAASASVSHYKSGSNGALTLLDTTSAHAGTVDASASTDGHTLYVQTGAHGIVDEYHINPDGSLAAIGSVTVNNAIGGEGIVAI